MLVSVRKSFLGNGIFHDFYIYTLFYLLPFSQKADPNLYAEGRRSSRVACEACRLSPNKQYKSITISVLIYKESFPIISCTSMKLNMIESGFDNDAFQLSS